MPESRYRWTILVLSYVCMLTFAFTLQSLPPILTLIIKALALSHAEAGLLMSLFALPAIFLAIPAGHFSDRYGAFKTGVTALILAVTGTSILAASSAGIVIAPYLAGMIKDKTGSYETSFLFLAVLAFLTTLSALAMRIKKRRNNSGS